MKKILTLIFILTFASIIFASIDYRIVYDSDGMGYDEVNGRYRIKLQIKSNDGDVPLGFFNLRILYNDLALLFNTEESYSSGPIEDHFYMETFDMYTLVPTAASAIRCGINGVYHGGHTQPQMCYYLDNTWTDCGVLVFNIINVGQSTNIRWDPVDVQNSIKTYDVTEIPDGEFIGDHDIFVNGGPAAVVPAPGLLYFSELSDNIPGQLETTAFIELKNILSNEMDLTDVSVLNFTNGFSVQLSGILPANGTVIITNGSDQATFEAAWNVTIDLSRVVFVQGDSQLRIGEDFMYHIYAPDTRETVDISRTVGVNQRIVQNQPNVWNEASNPTEADPGDNSLGQSLPVSFSAFNVAAESGKLVNIEWSTQSETDLIGYRLFRCETSEMDNAIPLNGNDVIEASNTSQTRNYKHTDNDVTFGTTYYYWIEVVQADNNSGGFYGPQSITISKDSVAPIASTSLASNYPNPFNPDTKIEFSIKGEIGEMVDASLVIYNIKGQKVKTLFDKIEVKENDFRMWNGTDDNDNPVSSGVYFYKLQTPDYTKTSKMVLMK